MSRAALHQLSDPPERRIGLPSLRCLMLGAALLSGGASAGCVARGTGYVDVAPMTLVVVEERPPPPRREVRPAVGVGFIWIDGRWDRRDNRWAWQSGRVERARSGHVWNPGRWQPRGRGHVWIEGSWHVSSHGPKRR